MIRPLSHEEIRLLRAAAEGRFLENAHGRYVIEGEARPDRRLRESLRNRGLIVYTFEPRGWVLTTEGLRRLDAAINEAAT